MHFFRWLTSALGCDNCLELRRWLECNRDGSDASARSTEALSHTHGSGALAVINPKSFIITQGSKKAGSHQKPTQRCNGL